VISNKVHISQTTQLKTTLISLNTSKTPTIPSGNYYSLSSNVNGNNDNATFFGFAFRFFSV
jgi:hypothetical protein